MKKIRLYLTGLLLVISFSAFAQNITVTGTVTDASTGQPVAAVSVLLKGSTTQYTQTDDLGNYKITVPQNGVLVYSFLGFKTVEMPVNGRSAIDVALTFESESLGDVVVVAYGTVRKEASTGSVTTFTGDVIADSPVTSVDKMLSGKIPGVSITSSSGQPGAGSSIRIRGASSINAGSEPLWVVDGIPVLTGDFSSYTNTSNAISSINPNDIESITVLKDAAATSLYGSRAANGVIIVTTKGGKAGKAKFSARVKFGGSMLANDHHYGPMNAAQILDLQRQAAINAGFDPDDPNSEYYLPMTILDRPMTDWVDAVTRHGLLQEYEINAQAGSSKGRFYSSLNYQKNDGIVYSTDMQKVTARVNSDYDLTRTLKIGTRVNLTYKKQNDQAMTGLQYSNPFYAAMHIMPWTPLKDENGDYNLDIPENSDSNPLWTAKNDKQYSNQYHVNGILFLQWEPVKGLVIKTNNSVESIFEEGVRYWYPEEADTKESLLQSRNKYVMSLNTSNTINYSNTWGDHNFSALVGQEAMRYGYKSYSGKGDVDRKIPYLSTANPESVEVGYSQSAETLLSFFGKVDYSYADRYFINASLRGDGSSLFGSDNKWGMFWAVSASWNMANENWLKDVSWLDILKIRLSYGLTGNNNIGPYKAYGKYAASTYAGKIGFVPSSPSNSNLSWEKNKELNVGLDFGFFEGRLYGSVDFYQKITTDMLLSRKIPQTSGFSTNTMNTGSLKNTGLEVLLEGEIIKTNDWLWSVGANIAFNKSKILDLAGAEFIGSSVRHVVGKSFYTYYRKEYYGVNPTNGDALFVDDNGRLTNNRNKARDIYCGSPEPKFFGGFNTMLSWKGLSLSAFFEYKYGNLIYNGESSKHITDGNRMDRNQLVSAGNYWKKPGDIGVHPRPVANNSTSSYSSSTRWIQDGSYLRFKDITLSYSLPKTALDKIRLQGLKFYVSGLNLYTAHDVDQWDPERGIDGYESAMYPVTKTIVGGIEITF